MTLIAFGAGAVVALAELFVFAALFRSLIRQHARERDLLLNQMLNLVGKPWQAAPAETVVSEPEPDDNGRYVLTPESLPDY